MSGRLYDAQRDGGEGGYVGEDRRGLDIGPSDEPPSCFAERPDDYPRAPTPLAIRWPAHVECVACDRQIAHTADRPVHRDCASCRTDDGYCGQVRRHTDRLAPRVKVQHHPSGSYQAWCLCGWDGDRCKLEVAATRQGDEHLTTCHGD